MSVKLIVDSSCELTQQEASEKGIYLIPMTVRFSNAEYHAGVDLDAAEFYDLLGQAKELPTTSQPTPYDFESVYAQIASDGDEAVVLCVSSALSGTYQSACIAAENYPNRVHVIDTQTVSVGQRILVEYALRLITEESTAAQVAQKLEAAKQAVCVYGTVATFEYLVKGGRLSKAAGTVGSLLGIRPLLTVKEGVLAVVSKPRGAKAANVALTQAVLQHGICQSMPTALGYTGTDISLLAQYQAANLALWPQNTTPIIMIGGTIGTHTGPGTLVVAFFRKDMVFV